MAATVSVVIPVHNGMPYLRAALDSVLTQDGVELEVVVVNDGSDDGTAEYLASVGDRRLRVVDNDRNRGLVFSLNRGVTEAGKDLIARLDADDLAAPGRLARQAAMLDTSERTVLVGGGVRIIDESGAVVRRSQPPELPGAIQVILNFANPFHHSTAMFRRSAWEAVGGYDEAAYPAEDYDLWIRLSEVGLVAAVRDCVATVTNRASGISNENLTRQSAMLHDLAARRIQTTLDIRPAPAILGPMLGYSLSACADVALADRLVLDVTAAVRREPPRVGVWGWQEAVGAAHVLHAFVRYRTHEGRRCLTLLVTLPLRAPSIGLALLLHRLSWQYKQVRIRRDDWR